MKASFSVYASNIYQFTYQIPFFEKYIGHWYFITIDMFIRFGYLNKKIFTIVKMKNWQNAKKDNCFVIFLGLTSESRCVRSILLQNRYQIKIDY